ncbi:MAG: multiheme c-type cytochrome, partial [Candidatus Methanoperedens sp.]|nr:multiheme c-type cytochrome [Candidatus Methanoperedens sp.]
GNYSYKGNLFDPEPPEVLNKSGKVPATARDGTQFYNHSADVASSYDDAKCKTCHDNNLGAGATSLNFTHSLSSSSGGANCTGCHGLSGSLSDGKKINQTAMNTSFSIHKDLNKDALASDANYSGSKKCWACHGDGTEPSGHSSIYKTPYNCADCHVQDAGQNFNYAPNNTVLNVTQHYWNGTSIGTANATSCYICHNRSEMMVGLTLDPDGASTVVYGSANGGNLSVSHYGRKRSDMAVMSNTTYCNYCHNNQSSVFPFINATNNKTIANHSLNYAATNPSCSDCHASGRLHNSTLYKPAFDMSNVTYCLSCHGNNGTGGTNYTGAVTGYREKHNNSLCTGCHINSTRSIHPVRYLLQNNTWGNTNNTAVNCTSCHQGAGMPGFSAAFIVETPMLHSNNTYSGAMWNGTQPRYWDNTSQLSSCYYCHGKASLHNASRLGNSGLVQGGNSLNQSLIGGYWCANCHYNGSAPSGKYNYKGNLLNPIPPEILNLTGLVPANSSDGIPFQNHTANIAGDWSDARCKTCHGKELPADTTSATFLHKLNQSQPDAGGPDCLNCHASTAPAGSDRPPLNRRVNASAVTNYSVHKDLNKNAINSTPLSDNRSKACWACHSDGTQPVKHPADYLNPKKCEDCHVSGTFSAPIVGKHYPGAVFVGRKVYDKSDPNRTCVSCHNNSVAANLNLTYGTYEA